MKSSVAIFEDYKIRRLYDEKTETWFFSIVDIIQILTQQSDFNIARKYWNKLKKRLNKERSELVTNCHQLKMVAKDGKLRLTPEKQAVELQKKLDWNWKVRRAKKLSLKTTILFPRKC